MSRASACNTSSSSGQGIAVEELKRVNDFCDMPCPFFSLCLVQSFFLFVIGICGVVHGMITMSPGLNLSGLSKRVFCSWFDLS